MTLSIVILAAGAGTRMRSNLPKVLHKLAGKPLLAHVVTTAKKLSSDITVVYGHCGDQVKRSLTDLPVCWIEQKEQLGTGHAVLQAVPQIPAENHVLILYGDVPLICAKTLQALIDRTPKEGIGWITTQVDIPDGLGRIIRDQDNNPIAIIEERDATDVQKNITEINTGICLLPAKYLKEWLPNLSNINSQREYYLTDIFAVAVQHGINISTVSPNENIEIKGVNDKLELAQLERVFQLRQAEQLLLEGVTLVDPNRFDLRGSLSVGQDVVIDINVVIEGEVMIGANSYIAPNVILRDVKLGNNVRIEANSILEEAQVDNDCVVGPFARLRPGTQLKEQAKVGNFVEVKKSTIGVGSKVSHLAYIGDTIMGVKVNVGAGTITCNYDGANKYQTVIEDDVFIGTNNSLVAPVTISKGATTAAGSVINKNVAEGELAIARAKQVSIKGWNRPVKKVKT